MARYHVNAEIALLLERYSKPAFVPTFVLPPKDKMRSGEDTLKEVRKLSENAVNRIYAS